jgi:hypothetical protein
VLLAGALFSDRLLTAFGAAFFAATFLAGALFLPAPRPADAFFFGAAPRFLETAFFAAARAGDFAMALAVPFVALGVLAPLALDPRPLGLFCVAICGLPF